MHPHRIPAGPIPEPVNLKQALLALVVADHAGLWSLAELDRHLHPSSATPLGEEPNRAATEDAVEDLYAAGLIHRIGNYVCATRAAHAAELLSA